MHKNKDMVTADKISKLLDMMLELFKSFAMETTKMPDKIICFTTKSVNEFNHEIQEVVDEIRRNSGFFQNESREILKLGAAIQRDVQSCRESFNKELTHSRENITNFIDQSQINLNTSIQNLFVDVQNTLNTMQHNFASETTQLRVLVESDKWIPVYVIVLQILLVLLWRCKGKSSSKITCTVIFALCVLVLKKQQLPNIDISGPAMENSIAVVSFSEENKDLHLGIARKVASEFEIHQVYLGGMTNVSTLGLPSKVCLVFVDKNERNIILETDVDVSKTRASFVEGQLMRGRTQVFVIYCQHEGSRGLEMLYDRSLGNIKKQETLRKLQGQLRVLSIDKEFSTYQSTYLRTFLKETLTE